MIITGCTLLALMYRYSREDKSLPVEEYEEKAFHSHNWKMMKKDCNKGDVTFECEDCGDEHTVHPNSVFNDEECRVLLDMQNPKCKNEEVVYSV